MIERDLVTGPRGLRLRLCEWGAGPPVVVLHGFLEQGAAWDAVARHLPGRRIVAPDLRGHGLSEHVGPGGWYHFWDYVPDVDAVADDAGGRVDLVGHSMGATVAALFAAVRPEKVRRLVLVEGLGPPDQAATAVDRPRAFLDAVATPPGHRPLAHLDEAVDRMRRFNPRLSVEVATRLATRITRPVRPDDRFDGAPGPDALVWTWDPLHRGRNPIPFVRSAFEPFVRRIAAPTLLVNGGSTPLVLPDHAERAGWIRDLAEITIPGAGHLIHLDAPEALAAAIATHLEPEWT